MIVCTQCAFQNRDEDSFCGSCGGFLEWTGERSAPPATDDIAPEVPAKRSLLSRVQTALSLDVVAPGEEPPPAMDTSASRPGGGPPGTGGPPGAAGGPPRPGGGPPGSGSGVPRPGGGAPGAPTRSAPPGAPPAGAPPRSAPPGAPPAGAPPRSAPPGAPPAGAPPRSAPPGAPPAGAPPRSAPPGAPPKPDTAPELDTRAAAAGLVASNATAPAPSAPPEPPRTVARKSVERGETTVGGPRPTEPTGATQPGAVVPVKPSPKSTRPKPTKQAPVRKPLPGDLICGECGEGNPPARNFCSRCGNTLRDAAVAKRKWWQRLIPRRRRKAMDAGARPWRASDGSQKRRKGGKLVAIYAKARPIVAGILLVASLVVGFTPNLRERATGKIGDVKDSLMSKVQPTYVALSPISLTATSEDPDQPASNVIDGNPLSFWVAPATDREPTLVVRFDQPFDLERIQLWNGSATGFKDHERVRELHFVFDTGQSFDLEVKDLPEGELYDIDNGDAIREVEIHVVGTFSSLATDELGLSEIEFYFRE